MKRTVTKNRKSIIFQDALFRICAISLFVTLSFSSYAEETKQATPTTEIAKAADDKKPDAHPTEKQDPVVAINYQKDLEELINSEIKQWVQKEVVINAIKEQNTQNNELSEIEFKNLNNTWKTDKRKGLSPLIDRVMNNPLSDYLRKIQDDSKGLYTEIIMIDNKGLSVGSSILSEDYWHANKPKWQKTLGVKSYAPYISDLHFDDTTELFQIEVSFMIISEDEPIGVAYAGIDVEQLERWKKNKEGL